MADATARRVPGPAAGATLLLLLLLPRLLVAALVLGGWAGILVGATGARAESAGAPPSFLQAAPAGAPAPAPAPAPGAGSLASTLNGDVGRRKIIWLGDVQIGARRVVLEVYEGATPADIARLAHTACLDHACKDAHQQRTLEDYILQGVARARS